MNSISGLRSSLFARITDKPVHLILENGTGHFSLLREFAYKGKVVWSELPWTNCVQNGRFLHEMGGGRAKMKVKRKFHFQPAVFPTITIEVWLKESIFISWLTWATQPGLVCTQLQAMLVELDKEAGTSVSTDICKLLLYLKTMSMGCFWSWGNPSIF